MIHLHAADHCLRFCAYTMLFIDGIHDSIAELIGNNNEDAVKVLQRKFSVGVRRFCAIIIIGRKGMAQRTNDKNINENKEGADHIWIFYRNWRRNCR